MYKYTESNTCYVYSCVLLCTPVYSCLLCQLLKCRWFLRGLQAWSVLTLTDMADEVVTAKGAKKLLKKDELTKKYVLVHSCPPYCPAIL